MLTGLKQCSTTPQKLENNVISYEYRVSGSRSEPVTFNKNKNVIDSTLLLKEPMTSLKSDRDRK